MAGASRRPRRLDTNPVADRREQPDRDQRPSGSIRSGKLAGRTLPAAIWIVAAPIMVQQLMHAFVGLVDKIIAGSLADDIRLAALDGLGIGSYVGWFIGIALTGLGIGGQAIIARSIGAGNTREAGHALGQAIGLSVAWGACVAVLLWAAAPLVAGTCGLTDEAAVYCVQYVRVLACGLPLNGIMLVGSMCLHGAGETTRPSAIAISVSAMNAPLSWLLAGSDVDFLGMTFVDPLGLDLNVVGIALGTVLSWGVGAVLTMVVLVRGVKDLRLRRAEIAPDAPMMLRIARVGVPNFMEGISMWAVNLFVLMVIGTIAERSGAGAGLQGAHIIAVQWEAFSFLPGFAIGTAAGALAGQYLGAGNARQARRAVVLCTVIASIVMCSLGAVFALCGEWLTSLVSTEPVHLQEVPRLLLVCGVTQIFFAITMVIRQGLRGVGDTRWTFLITTASSYGVRLPAAWVLGVALDLGLTGVWIGLCGELAVRAALFTARFLHGGWTKVEV